MNVDAIFKIGTSHTVCDDFAISSSVRRPTFIISDGCSGSRNTDIGSRIISLCAMKLINSMSDLDIVNSLADDVGKTIANMALLEAEALKLDEDALDATLLIGVVVNDATFIFTFGDGAIATSRCGTLRICHLENESGAPFYVNYYNNESRMNIWKREADIGVVRIGLVSRPVDSALKLKLSNSYDFICLISDGIETIADTKAVSRLFCFKNTNGMFLRRRLNRWIKEGSDTFSDDLSIAGVAL